MTKTLQELWREFDLNENISLPKRFEYTDKHRAEKWVMLENLPIADSKVGSPARMLLDSQKELHGWDVSHVCILNKDLEHVEEVGLDIGFMQIIKVSKEILTLHSEDEQASEDGWIDLFSRFIHRIPVGSADHQYFHVTFKYSEAYMKSLASSEKTTRRFVYEHYDAGYDEDIGYDPQAWATETVRFYSVPLPTLKIGLTQVPPYPYVTFQTIPILQPMLLSPSGSWVDSWVLGNSSYLVCVGDSVPTHLCHAGNRVPLAFEKTGTQSWMLRMPSESRRLSMTAPFSLKPSMCKVYGLVKNELMVKDHLASVKFTN